MLKDIYIAKEEREEIRAIIYDIIAYTEEMQEEDLEVDDVFINIRMSKNDNLNNYLIALFENNDLDTFLNILEKFLSNLKN